jgi:hypothetical protein
VPTFDFPPFIETIRMALRLDPEIFALAFSTPQSIGVALVVVLLAAVSEAIGQSLVLFINRVRPWRFVLAQAIAILSHFIGYLLWSTVIWLAVWFIFGVREPFVATLAVVGLAYAPQLFAFFEMMPWLGNSFGLLLSLWSMAAVVVAIQFGMNVAIWQAALTGLISWAAIQVFRRSLGRPIYALGRYIQHGAADSQMTFSLADIYEGNLNREEYSPTLASPQGVYAQPSAISAVKRSTEVRVRAKSDAQMQLPNDAPIVTPTSPEASGDALPR